MKKFKDYKDEIKIINRDGDIIKLIRVVKNVYRLDTGNDLPFGVTFGEKISDYDIVAVDPSGGPYISVGSMIEGLKVGGIVYSKKDKAYLIRLDK